MAQEKVPDYRDMLDIIFADRNKSYGAYQLRRSYPAYLGRALAIGALLIILLFSLPYIMAAVRGVLAKAEKPIDVVAELGPPPDIDPNTPPPPPPPPVETPPPPTRSTVRFVPPVVKKDEEVVEEEQIQNPVDEDKDVSKETKEGNDEAPPSIEENPSELAVVEEPVKAPVEEKTYEMFDIQKPPSFPGGEPALLKYLAENIKYPPLARENNIQGVVALTFVVNKDGRVSDVQVLKDIGGGCGKEAVRVVQSMPKWAPGEANGNPVKVRFTLPVRFKLE